MATPVNPFHADLGRGKRRTLPEIEAATRGSKGADGPKAFRRRPEVFKWLSDQEAAVQQSRPNALQPNRPNPLFVSVQGHGATGQRPRGLIAHAGAAARPSYPVPHTHASSRHFSSKGLKRSASSLDDSADDVIYVGQTPRRQPKPPIVVDLTRSSRPRRQTSFSGGRDDDVIIIDPPTAEIRGQLRNLALGRPRPRDAEVPPRKRQKRVNARLAPARGSPERPARENSEVEEVVVVAAPEPNVAEADANEAAALIQSAESVTYFFALATEIRDKIYRHLLVSPKPIQVQHLWTEPRRSTTRRVRGDDVDNTPLDTKILLVCRRTAMEGTRVLYSENTFLYLLRDPEVVDVPNAPSGRRSQRVAAKAQRESRSTIDLEKYGHLIRHMAIELEPNRTTTDYEKLMSAALETLIPAGIGLPLLPSPSRPPCGPIHLHTLAITISPLFEVSQRTVRGPAAGNQDVVIREGRFLSTVGFFSRGAPVLKALQRVNVDFLRINVHVNSDIQNDDDDYEDDDYDSDLDGSESESERPQQPRRHHLETTIDLRCLPRHLEALSRESQLWANDALMREKRRQQGAEAEAKLASLRRHIEDACLRPEQALREKFWEEHGSAERRRREQRAKEERRFDADAYDAQAERGGGGDDGRIARGMKSLIISIDRVGNGLRAYRA